MTQRNDYQKALAAAERRLLAFSKQKDRIDQRVGRLHQTIVSLSKMEDENPEDVRLYDRARDAANQELAGLLITKDEVDKRVARLEQTVSSLTALDELENPKIYLPSSYELVSRRMVAGIARTFLGRVLGVSDAIREVLIAADKPLTPTQVRDALVARGADLDRYSNILAVIHTTLRRLESGGEVSKSRTQGKTAYRWNTTLVTAESQTLIAVQKDNEAKLVKSKKRSRKRSA